MIPKTEFIPAYSELFKFLERQGGQKAVQDFWSYLSDNFLSDLRSLVQQDGLRGCWLYWSHALNEEAADFTMELDEAMGEFKIIRHHCPSRGSLLEYKHIEPYHDYCGHCDVFYRRVLEPLGYEYIFNDSESDKAKCVLIVRDKKS